MTPGLFAKIGAVDTALKVRGQEGHTGKNFGPCNGIVISELAQRSWASLVFLSLPNSESGSSKKSIQALSRPSPVT